MKINLHMLGDILERMHFTGSIRDSWQTRSCSYPLLAVEHLDMYKEGPLYVTSAEALGEEVRYEGHPSILSVGKPGSAWLDSPCNLMWTEENLALDTLANTVSAQFARYQEWADKLQHIVDTSAPPRELAACNKGIVDNPTYAMGPEMYLICSYTPEVDHDTEAYAAYRKRYNMEFGVYEGPEVIADSLTMEDYFELPPTPTPTITRSPFGHDVLYHTLYLNDMPFATVCIDGIASPITNRDKVIGTIWGHFLFQLLTGDAGLHLRQERLGGEVLHGLLEHVLQPERKIQSFLRLRSWDEADEFLCGIARNNTSSDPTITEYLALSIVRNIGSTCYEVREGAIVLVFNLTKLCCTKDDLTRQLIALLGKRDVTASISRAFKGFENVWYYYQQAVTAESIGYRNDPTLWFFDYGDYELADMIERAKSGTVAKSFVPEGLRRLIDHDRERDGLYGKTLRVYLDCERNIAETSRRLFVHRNTFLYRLSKIQEMLGVDLDDPDERLELSIVLRMLEQSSDGIK